MEYVPGPFAEMGFSQLLLWTAGFGGGRCFAGGPAALCAVLTVSGLGDVES